MDSRMRMGEPSGSQLIGKISTFRKLKDRPYCEPHRSMSRIYVAAKSESSAASKVSLAYINSLTMAFG